MTEPRDYKGALRWGLAIAALLFVLTIVELVVARTLPGIAMLLLIAVLKAGLIIKEFMHIGLVFEGGGEH